jgi:hypothetical protein
MTGRLSDAERTAAGLAAGPRDRRVVLAVYSSGSTAQAWQRTAAQLPTARLGAVMLHDAPRADLGPTAREIRARGSALWYGVGIDGWARDLRSGTRTAAQISARAVSLARIAADQGAELVMWNGEAAFVRTPGTDDTDARVESVLAQVFDAVQSQVGIAQGFTSYDCPLWHPIGWGEICGPRSPVSVLSLQRYVSGGTGPLQGIGALRARHDRSAAQLCALVARGDCRPDLADGGVGCLPYLQIHGVQAAATVAYAVEQRGVCLWAAGSRSDDAGAEAVAVLAAIDRAGLWGDVRGLQRVLGVAEDGAYGPATHAAALVWARRP